MMQGGDAQRYPFYEDDDKQEAARFLCSDFTSEKGHDASEEDHLHAQPIIDGIVDIERLNKWTEVKKDLGSRVQKADREALRRQRRELTADADVEFQPASEIDTNAEAEAPVADGGTVVEDDKSAAEVESATDTDCGWEIGPDQERMEYTDEAEFESQKNDWRGFVFSETYDTVKAVEEQLDEVFQRDVVRPHVVELLQERLEELKA